MAELHLAASVLESWYYANWLGMGMSILDLDISICQGIEYSLFCFISLLLGYNYVLT